MVIRCLRSYNCWSISGPTLDTLFLDKLRFVEINEILLNWLNTESLDCLLSSYSTAKTYSESYEFSGLLFPNDLLNPEHEIFLLLLDIFDLICGVEGVWLPLAASYNNCLEKSLKFNFSKSSCVVLFLYVVNFLPPNEFFWP